MPPLAGTPIIKVILPSGEQVLAYYDRSTSPGFWRNAETDAVIEEWTDRLVVHVILTSGEELECYWNAATESAWKGVDTEEHDRDVPLSRDEILSIAVVDLRGRA